MIKKSILGLIGVLLVCTIVFTALTPAFASLTGQKAQTSLKETDRNYYYVLVFQNLINSFPTTLMNGESGEIVVNYPVDYAGAYIDQSGNLHIVLTKNTTITTENNYQKILGNDEDIIFETADFPLSYLYGIQRALDGAMEELGIESTVLNEITNKLEIHLLDNTKEKAIIEFLKIKFNNFDDRCIVFEGTVGIKTTAANTASNALAGSKTSTTITSATLGFNAYRSSTGQYGVVTAAHYATSGTSIKNAMGTTIGSASVRQQSGTVDAAFVPFPTSITRSYRIYSLSTPYEDCITGWFANSAIVTGMNTEKVGDTTGYTSGYILSVSVSVTCDGITFTDQVKVSNTQLAGDSGAPVFQSLVGPILPPTIRTRTLVGIATMADSSNNGYVSKVANIMSALGISPYTT